MGIIRHVYSFKEHGFCGHHNALSMLALGWAYSILRALTELLDHVDV